MTTEAKNRELLLLFFELDEKPDPAKKEAFLKIVMTGQITRATNMTLHRMLLIQVKYIRKTAWLAARQPGQRTTDFCADSASGIRYRD